MGNDVSCRNTRRSSKWLLSCGASAIPGCGWISPSLSPIPLIKPIECKQEWDSLETDSSLHVLLVIWLGMWAGEESSLDGLYNSWFSGISNSGVSGRVGYWELWGEKSQWVRMFVGQLNYSVFSLLYKCDDDTSSLAHHCFFCKSRKFLLP